MKTFKKFFEAPAADYVAPKDDDDEAKDIKPRSKGEKKFKDDHKDEKKKHPTASDVVHTGDIKKEEVEMDEAFSVEVPKQKIGGKTYGGGANVIVKAKTASQAIKMVAKRLKVDVDLLKTGKVVKEEEVKEGELPPALKKAIAKKKGEKPEDEDELDEDVFSDLENIVKKKSMKKVKFANGKTLQVDLFTASAFVNMFKKVNPNNAERGKAHIDKSPENFMKMMDLAMGGSKK